MRKKRHPYFLRTPLRPDSRNVVVTSRTIFMGGIIFEKPSGVKEGLEAGESQELIVIRDEHFLHFIDVFRFGTDQLTNHFFQGDIAFALS